jgi:hypothetical protein
VASLVSFGAQFAIGGQDYWDFAIQAVGVPETQQAMPTTALITVINNLRDVGLLGKSMTLYNMN